MPRALALVVALASCYRGGATPEAPPSNHVEAPPPVRTPPPPPAPTEIEAAIEAMGSFAEAMCACPDRACADDVQQGMTAWAEEMAKRDRGGADLKPDEAEMQQMSAHAMRYAECLTKAMSATP